jgi:hypothetical protein
VLGTIVTTVAVVVATVIATAVAIAAIVIAIAVAIAIAIAAQDEGGPYRESWDTMCAELQSPNLPLFVRCPNALHNSGQNRCTTLPVPLCVCACVHACVTLVALSLSLSRFLSLSLSISLYLSLLTHFPEVSCELHMVSFFLLLPRDKWLPNPASARGGSANSPTHMQMLGFVGACGCGWVFVCVHGVGVGVDGTHV